MKTKQQKRIEAIQRLEREPRGYRMSELDKKRLWERRKEEARRLRMAFGH